MHPLNSILKHKGHGKHASFCIIMYITNGCSQSQANYLAEEQNQ